MLITTASHSSSRIVDTTSRFWARHPQNHISHYSPFPLKASVVLIDNRGSCYHAECRCRSWICFISIQLHFFNIQAYIWPDSQYSTHLTRLHGWEWKMLVLLKNKKISSRGPLSWRNSMFVSCVFKRRWRLGVRKCHKMPKSDICVCRKAKVVELHIVCMLKYS